jgi:hypothetical protein
MGLADLLGIADLHCRKVESTKWLKHKLRARDVSTGATGATEVAPKFSDTLTLSPPGGADSAHHRRGRN